MTDTVHSTTSDSNEEHFNQSRLISSMKFYESNFLLETAVKAKLLTFVLPTEKCLEVLFWTFLHIS